MSIRYLKHASIDKSRWDDTIANASQPLIYANSWYLDVVSPRWEALVMNDYEIVMPLTWRKKFGIHYLYQPYFAQQLGVISREEVNDDRVHHFLNAIPTRFQFIDIHLNTSNPVGQFDAWRIERRITHHLDLARDYETIVSGFSGNRKSDIRKEAQEVHVEEFWDSQVTISALKNNLGERLAGFTEKDWQRLDHLLGILKERGCATGYRAMMNGVAVAYALMFPWRDTLVYFAGASTEQGKRAGATALIFDHAIAQHAGKMRVLDFEGSMIPGIAQYFKSFGGVEVPYWRVSLNRLPWPLKLFKR